MFSKSSVTYLFYVGKRAYIYNVRLFCCVNITRFFMNPFSKYKKSAADNSNGEIAFFERKSKRDLGARNEFYPFPLIDACVADDF